MREDKTKQIMGLVIVAFREKCGDISRYALAKKAGVDYAWLRRFEQGKTGIRVETLILLARGLEIPASSIVEIIEKALSNPDNWLKEHKEDLEKFMNKKNRKDKKAIS